MGNRIDAMPRAASPQHWISIYAERLVELAAGRVDPPISEAELRAFALNCARGGYPAFLNDDPAECAEAEFLEWPASSR